jgi:hypothetical protein
MTDADDRRTDLGRVETVSQWVLAAVTDDADRLDELQDLFEQACPCCTAAVTRTLAQLAGYFSIRLRGQEGAERDAEQLLVQCLDEIAALEDE